MDRIELRSVEVPPLFPAERQDTLLEAVLDEATRLYIACPAIGMETARSCDGIWRVTVGIYEDVEYHGEEIAATYTAIHIRLHFDELGRYDYAAPMTSDQRDLLQQAPISGRAEKRLILPIAEAVIDEWQAPADHDEVSLSRCVA